MMHRDLALFADYYQFYLQDEAAEGNLSEAWSDDAVDRLLAVAPGAIGVGTARNMTVPVTIEVVDRKPMMEADSFDHIVECSVTFGSGNIVVAGWADDLEEVARFSLVPGTYRVRVNYAGLNMVSPDGLEGNDRYCVQLWPAVEGPVTILKNRAHQSSGSAVRCTLWP